MNVAVVIAGGSGHRMVRAALTKRPSYGTRYSKTIYKCV